MKRILALLSVVALVFCATPSFSANLNDLQTADLSALVKGRVNTSPSTTDVLEVSYTGSGSAAQISASANTGMWFSVLSSTSSTVQNYYYSFGQYTTLYALLSAINNGSHGLTAKLGPDGYNGMLTQFVGCNRNNGDNTNIGTDASPATCFLDTQTFRGMVVGVQGKDNKIVRLKRVVDMVGGTGVHTLKIIEADTNKVIYRKLAGGGQFNTTYNTAIASPWTVEFAGVSNQGLCSNIGGGLVVEVRWSTTAVVAGSTWAPGDDLAGIDTQLGITYDQITR